MIADTLAQLKPLLGTLSPSTIPPMTRVLMVSPEHFRVDYAINPFMRTATGELQTIDTGKAQSQWHQLKTCYEHLGFTVDVLPSPSDLPDMVFAANQSLIFWESKTNKPAVLLSRMRSDQRDSEVAHFRRFFETQPYQVYALEQTRGSLEGNGDALFHPANGILWGAFGPRTQKEVYDEISQRFDLPVIRLALQCPEFYHLDTCFSILSASAVALYPKAFLPEALKMIHEVFPTVIELSYEETLNYFAGNCHSPNGKDVILQRGSRVFLKKLEEAGFQTHEVDTSEFMKSGGSVFCLKMMRY
jgi:N-dimethylarginine dimethylaminohydrolase